jgi:hypothetical protein
VGNLLGFLAPAAPLVSAGLGFVQAKEAGKAAELAARREHELSRLSLQAQPEQVRPAWMSPPVFLGGVAVLGLLVWALARK